MIQLIYISTASNRPSEADLLFLLKQARSKNLRKHITGMLLYSNSTYLQILEGEARDFPDWSMGFENLESRSPDQLPGFVGVFGGKLDKSIAINNKTNAIRLLMNFSKKGG